MIHDMDLEHTLNSLDQLKDRHERGSKFEEFVTQILEEEGFDVTFDPKVAKPRQTDLYAQRDELFFIVETKWQRKPLDVGHIDDVRTRLKRTVGDVFACVFSMSGYAGSAITDLTNLRRLEILLFKEAEIRGIVAGDLSFADLLQRKRDEFRKNALVWFEDWKPRPWKRPLSTGPEEYRLYDQYRDCILSSTQGDDVIFVRNPLDLGLSVPASLRLQVRAKNLAELQMLLRTTKHQLGLAGSDSFAIHQGNAGWYGTGVQNFITATRNWKERYAELNWKSYHHSERLAYFDELQSGGLFILTMQQQVRRNIRYHYGCIEILLPGIPVDPSGIRRLCNKTNNQTAKFELGERKSIDTHRFCPPVELEAVGLIMDAEGWAVGIVAKNPFYKPGVRSSFDVPSLRSNSAIRHLSNTELLPCRLKSWHRAGEFMNKYQLFDVDGCWIENAPALYVGCDWS
ncbi:MAG TPA: restriction endonuclease [Candidatus Dormibacteraeota bacterium]|jgi:hypothetical protein|nr:restriction endonuclease [Candidatus Dormibacteraeota bacterium]